jgi:hypothetical protein
MSAPKTSSKHITLILVLVVTSLTGFSYKFSIWGLTVNLKTGLLRIGPDEKEVVQNVALSFVVSTLYLLVQPRPQDPKVVAQATIKRGPKKVKLILKCQPTIHGHRAKSLKLFTS